MRGCVLAGKVVFEDGVIPAPRWPDERPGSVNGREPGEEPSD
jgi:hypothetical protein